MSNLELVLPRDLPPVLTQMLAEATSMTSTLGDYFTEIQMERQLLQADQPPVPASEISSDEIIGADLIEALPLDRAEKVPVQGKEEKLDHWETRLREQHEANVQRAEAALWGLDEVLKKQRIDFVATAAVLETVTPYEGGGQVVAQQVGQVFQKMRWRMSLFEHSMPLLGLQPAGTDQYTAIGGIVQEVEKSPGRHGRVILGITLKEQGQFFRTLPPLIDANDPNYLYYARRERADFSQAAFSRGLSVAQVDAALQASGVV